MRTSSGVRVRPESEEWRPDEQSPGEPRPGPERSAPLRFAARLNRLPFAAQAAAVLASLLTLQYWRLVTGVRLLPSRFLADFPAVSGSVAHHFSLRSQQLTDLTTQQFPWQSFDASALRSGHLPLWDPHLLMGVPQVASWLPAVFDPWHLGYLLMPPIVWWDALFPLHQLVAGLGAALLARRLTRSRLGGLAAGVAYGLGGFVAGHNGQNQGEMACLLPFLLLAVLWLAERPTWRRASVLGLVIATMVLVGHPETLLFSLVTAGVLAVAVGTRLPRGDKPRFVGGLGCSLVVGLGCSAVQWLPGIAWLTGSARMNNGAIHVHAATLGLLDFLSRDATSGVNSLGILLPSAAVYLGVATLWLAGLGLMSWRRTPVVPVLAALALVSGLVAFGVQPLYGLAESLPLIRASRLDFLLMVTDFSLALLAAFGVAWVREAVTTRSGRLAGTRAWIVLAGLSFAGLYLLSRKTLGRHGLSFSLLHGPLGTEVLVDIVALLLLPVVARRAFVVPALLLVSCLDLATWSLGYHHFLPANASPYRQPRVVSALHRLDPSGTYRVLAVGHALPLDFALPLGLYDPIGYGPYEAETSSFWSGLMREPPGGHLTPLPARVAAPGDHRLDMADVKYVLATAADGSAAPFFGDRAAFRLVDHVGPVQVFENLDDLGPAFVVPATGVRRAAQSEAAALVRSPAFEPSRQAVLSSSTTPLRHGRTGTAKGEPAACGCVRHFRESAGRVSFEVSASSPSLAVVSQSWAPGWHATVDGRAVAIRRADVSLDGLEVPAGRSRVVMVYEPASLTAGIAVSLASLGLLLAATSAGELRRHLQRARRSRSPAGGGPE